MTIDSIVISLFFDFNLEMIKLLFIKRTYAKVQPQFLKLRSKGASHLTWKKLLVLDYDATEISNKLRCTMSLISNIKF